MITNNKQMCAARRIAAAVLGRILISAAFFSTSGHFVLHADGWTRSREIGTFPKGEVPFESFTLDVWGGDGIHVHGVCGYYNVKETPVEIGGKETSAGEFYPDVIYEVSDGDGVWETLEAPTSNVGTRITTIVEARKRSRPLNVNLDVFVPFIGKLKYGRVVLQTAEGAVFRIEELQPEKRKDGAGNSAEPRADGVGQQW